MDLAVFGQSLVTNAPCELPTFLAGRSITTGGLAGSIIPADFNNDGKRDVAVNLFTNTRSVEIKFGDANGSFTTVSTISSFTSLMTADFNADGYLDLLGTRVQGSTSNKILLFAGDGAGNFTEVWTVAPEAQFTAGVAGDFNGDDRMDFALTDTLLQTVRIYYGDGNGNFPSNNAFAVGNTPNSIAKADFNNDGRSDLIINNNDSSFVNVLLSNGDGGFNPPFFVSTASNTNAGNVSVGDINGDGKGDAVVGGVGNSSSGTSILLGDGAGNLTLQPFLASDAGANGVLLSDVNGDSKLDLISIGQGLTVIRQGNGNGTFGEENSFSAAGQYFQIVDDFNGDGNADLAQSSGAYNEFTIFFGSGNTKFGAPAISVGGQPNSSTTADFNNDGKPDIAIGNYDLSNVQVITNNGNGNYAVTSTFSFADRPWSVFSGDFNNDEKVDLGTITWHTGFGNGKVAVMLNNGNGFSAPVIYSNSLRFLRAVTVGDVTNDNILDIVIAAVDSPGVIYIMKGTGNGTFSSYLTFSILPGIYAYSPWGVAVGDFNRDGKNDIAATTAGNLFVYLNNGAGGFSQATLYPAGSPVAEIVLGDFNEDSILDAVVTNNDPNAAIYTFQPTVSILLGNGTGGFGPPTTYQTGRSASSIAIGDFNGDQHLDLAIANSYISAFPDNRVGILFGNGNGTFSSVQRFVAGSNAFDVSVADFNSDGKPDVATPNLRGGDVSILLNDCLSVPPSGFPALSVSDDITLTETDSGTINATFTVTLSSPSSRRVRVDYYTTADTAVGIADYQPVAGTLVFAPNEISKTITIPVRGDTTDEFNERFNVYLVNPLNASLADGKAVVNIVEDADLPPTASIGDVNYTEGNSGTVTAIFPFTLSEVSGKPISIQFAAASGTATPNLDFIPVSGTLNIPAGISQSSIQVTINGDTVVESDETFSVILTMPVNVTLSRSQGIGTIVNDDIGGNVQFANGGAFNVSENAGVAIITITRVNGNASGVTVNFTTADGGATAGQDYSAVNGSVTFSANETSRTFTIPILNDSLDEEQFESVNLSLTDITGGATIGIPSSAVLNIADDDPLPKIRINDVSVSEGNQGSTAAILTVSLSAASGRNVSVGYTTTNGTANTPNDYQSVSGTLNFAAGEMSKTIGVQINGDTNIELNETFQILLSNPVNSMVENSVGTVTIVNDDFRRNSTADFDGDSKADVSVYRPSGGNWYLLNSTTGFSSAQFGISTDKIVPADYDGDGKTDIAVFRGGSWFLQRSAQGFASIQFGNSDDIPAPADFDGDGKAELAVFRPADGVWYIRNLATDVFTAVQFGSSEDKPVTADYDGDGKSDLAVFRPSNGTWYILKSLEGFTAIQFGVSTDKTVSGDYDGDGRADQVVFRNGVWYLNRSAEGFTAVQFGAEGDIPVTADYDGDGKSDTAVFRNGVWYMLNSQQGFSAKQFGSIDDKPVPAAYIP